MKERLEAIKKAALEKIEQADAMDSLNDIRVSVLGKKGELTQVLKGMKDVAKEERPIVGQMVNDTRAVIEEALEKEMTLLKKKVREEKMKREVIDVTLPAKDEQDTFYINKDIVLRTQTSPVQARIMETGQMPIRMIAPGRVFRSDEVDATHSPSFHQVEGLVVDKGITFADLKGTLEQFAKEFFGPDTKVKFRPHHFPFTEPSAEVDVTCFKCGGKGCRMCKGSGWIEILGCGMVHPHVLEMCGIDPEVYSGFAFGIGLERVALLKYEIDDMRLLYENDKRFLSQF